MANFLENDGLHYLSLLQKLHLALRPKTYFEIGTRGGDSLTFADCKSVAVDPQFGFHTGLVGKRPVTHLFQMTSDDFFSNHNLEMILGAPVDLAFLDGLHQFEFLLRDFINTEKSCKPNSVVTIHDCLPTNFDMIPRRDNEAAWTGDVWKIIPVLRKYRPDIRMYCMNADPTGLVLCTNLNPSSTILTDNYWGIIDEWRDVQLELYEPARLISDANIRSTDIMGDKVDIDNYFWL